VTCYTQPCKPCKVTYILRYLPQGDESSPRGRWGICAPALPEVLEEITGVAGATTLGIPGVQDDLPGVQGKLPGVQDDLPGVQGELTGVPPQDNADTTSETPTGLSDLTEAPQPENADTDDEDDEPPPLQPRDGDEDSDDKDNKVEGNIIPGDVEDDDVGC
jgi:hypothetical protein